MARCKRLTYAVQPAVVGNRVAAGWAGHAGAAEASPMLTEFDNALTGAAKTAPHPIRMVFADVAGVVAGWADHVPARR